MIDMVVLYRKKSKKKPEILTALFESLGNGATITKSCAAINIAQNTFFRWMREDEKFAERVRQTFENRIKVVEDKLFRNCCGYFVEESITETRDTIKGEEKIEKTLKKYIPPNATSQMFYLKNRDPEHWKDKSEIDLTNKEAIAELESGIKGIIEDNPGKYQIDKSITIAHMVNTESVIETSGKNVLSED